MIDQKTADAFASSWNNLPAGSVYTQDQFEDWMNPIHASDVYGKRVLELGCGNGSQLLHMIGWSPTFLEGVDLGGSVLSARKNLSNSSFRNWRITQGDMVGFDGDGYDLVYSIGVLHHLDNPQGGFDAVVRNVKPGGRFHCWVYAKEGNSVVINLVDPMRKVTALLPWWFTKYLVATPLAVPFYCYAKCLAAFRESTLARSLPLYDYCLWISRREFAFFRHVSFDQLVTPKTAYISRETIQHWLASNERVDLQSVYVIMRNGNSWKFGGKVKEGV